MKLRVYGSWIRVQGLGFMVGVIGELKFGIKSLGVRVWSSAKVSRVKLWV